MDPPETADLDYLLGVGVGPPAPPPVPTLLPPVTASAAAAAATAATAATAVAVSPSPPPPSVSTPASAPAPSSAPASASTSGAEAGDAPHNSKKRPLEDKKARDRKRVLRNRELARVSNERRKGRIRAMENELTETRQTVSTLEESIRCLEAENKELRNLLQGNPAADAVPAPSLPTVNTPSSTNDAALPPPTTASLLPQSRAAP